MDSSKIWNKRTDSDTIRVTNIKGIGVLSKSVTSFGINSDVCEFGVGDLVDAEDLDGRVDDGELFYQTVGDLVGLEELGLAVKELLIYVI